MLEDTHNMNIFFCIERCKTAKKTLNIWISELGNPTFDQKVIFLSKLSRQTGSMVSVVLHFSVFSRFLKIGWTVWVVYVWADRKRLPSLLGGLLPGQCLVAANPPPPGVTD